MPRLAPRPLLMIHGGADTYIKPEMAQAPVRPGRASRRSSGWSRAPSTTRRLHLAGDEYRGRVLAFFEQHLADRRDRKPRRST